jgi:allantoicase
MARLRLWGELSASGRDDLALRWYNLLPAGHLAALLAARGAGAAEAAAAVADRPVTSRSALPGVVAAELPG